MGRWKQGLGRSTYVGALFTDVERAEDAGSGRPRRSRTFGIDTGVQLHPDWKFLGYWVGTSAPQDRGNTSAWSADLYYTGYNLRGEIQAARFGSGYDPQAGFVRQGGIRFFFGQLGWLARPAIAGIQDVLVDVYTFPKYNDDDGRLNERDTHYRVHANWRNGAFAEASLNDFDENLTEPLVLGNGATIAPGRYRFLRPQAGLGTNPSRALSFQANASLGDYYDGRRDTYTARLFWKPSEHVAISGIESYNVVRLPGGDFDLSLASVRVDWNASVALLASLSVQSDTLDRLTHVQTIVRWLIDPATDFFAVYDSQSGAGFESPGSRVTVKFRRTFDF